MNAYLKIEYAGNDEDFIFENEIDYSHSKFFGEILIRDDWIEKNIFSPDELFVCQLNLSEINHSLLRYKLPDIGMLYFFIDFKKPPYKAVVRFFDGEMNSAVCFNDEFESDINVIDELLIAFTDNEGDSVGELIFVDDNTEDCIALLRIDYFEEEPILPVDGEVYFIISKDDLANQRFDKAKLKIINYQHLL